MSVVFLMTCLYATGVDFNREILPILSDNCFKCHGPDENTREAELRLDTPEGAFGDLESKFSWTAQHPSDSSIIFSDSLQIT